MSTTSDDGETIEIMTQPGAETQSAASDQNPIACNICQRSYARIDHLARHIRTHSKQKPFTCDLCHKSFSRIDVLKRHADNHDSEGSAKRSRTTTQARVTRACRTCAAAKLKCSDSRPCARCVSRSIACEYVRKSIAVDELADGVHCTSPESTPQRNDDDPLVESDRPDATFDLPSEDIGQSHLATSLPAAGTDDRLLTPNSCRNDSLADPNSGTRLTSQPHVNLRQSESLQDLAMVDFMNSVMFQDPVDVSHGDWSVGALPDILDFSFDDSADFLNIDSLAQHNDVDQIQLSNKSGATTPGIQRLTSIGQQAFKDSMWLWTPSHTDNKTAEQVNLSLPTPELLLTSDLDTHYCLSLASRDRILSVILGTCDRSTQRRVVSCFPSVDMLSQLLSIYMIYHSQQVSSWIHPATLDVNEEKEEFLLALISAGASNSRFPNVRKLGYSMQEALRNSIPDCLETDNRATRDLRLSQTYALSLDIGLWSGNRRKMEIAESFANPLVTMLRRGDRFRSRISSDMVPLAADDEDTTEAKWRRWVCFESFNRLAYQLFLRDTGSSFAMMSQPLISYAELCLDLPCSPRLWQASNATDWRQVYLGQSECRTANSIPLQLRSVLDDPNLLSKAQSLTDIQMSLAVIVSTIWSRVWQCLQLKTLADQHSGGPIASNKLTVNIYQQELVHAGRNISLRSSDWSGGLGHYSFLLLELCMLHLHVSLEAVQTLAGKNGEEEARRVVPLLRKWKDSSDSRQAVFHAGQILLAAQQFPSGHLRDQSAVGVYHAGLTFWAFTVLSEVSLHPADVIQQPIADLAEDPVVLLDSVSGSEVQRFLVLGIGRPAIKCYTQNNGDLEALHSHVFLRDVGTTMRSVANLLANNTEDEHNSPTMVSNLNKLIRSLGNAASEIRRRDPHRQ